MSATVTATVTASLPRKRVHHADAIRAVHAALEGGLIVHAEHPDFGGTLTAGPSVRAGGSPVWEMIQHGGSCDVGDVCASMPELARRFVFQVGKWCAYLGAVRALDRAGLI